MGAARNHFSGHIYQGINRFLLDGFEVPRFATFNQVQCAGHRIRKAAKSLPIYFWKILFFDANGKRVETRQEAEKIVPYVVEYRVFNVLDIEGFTVEMFRPAPLGEDKPENIPARIDECEAILNINPHEVSKGEPAYSPLMDKLFMPEIKDFHSPEKFYHTYFHELSHWTGHSSRLNREIKNSFGSEKYSWEELVAEMSACFLAAHCSIALPEANR
jgi:antirestriction protein ArdC